MRNFNRIVLVAAVSALAAGCATRDNRVNVVPQGLTDVENPLEPQTLGLEPNAPDSMNYPGVSPVADGPELIAAAKVTLQMTESKINQLQTQAKSPGNDTAADHKRIGYLQAGADKVKEEISEYRRSHHALRERERVEAVEAVNELRSHLASIESKFR